MKGRMRGSEVVLLESNFSIFILRLGVIFIFVLFLQHCLRVMQFNQCLNLVTSYWKSKWERRLRKPYWVLNYVLANESIPCVSIYWSNGMKSPLEYSLNLVVFKLKFKSLASWHGEKSSFKERGRIFKHKESKISSNNNYSTAITLRKTYFCCKYIVLVEVLSTA